MDQNYPNQTESSDNLVIKEESIDPDLIKKEKEEENYFVIPGIVGNSQADKTSIKQEIIDNEECSSIEETPYDDRILIKKENDREDSPSSSIVSKLL